MPKGKRYYGRRKKKFFKKGRAKRAKKLITGKGDSWIEKAARYTGTAGRIAANVAQIMNLVNSEAKFLDVNQVITPVTTAGNVYPISLVPIGNTDNSRIGNQFLLKDINVNFTIYSPIVTSTAASPAPVASCVVRFMVICDKECDQSTPVIADVLQTVSPQSLINKDNSDRFTILRDVRVGLGAYDASTYVGKIYMKLPVHIYFDDSTSGIASARENNLFIIVLSDITAPQAQVTFYSRINYYDN